MPVVGKELREIMEAQFDVNNKELMSRLHPQTAEPQLPTNRSHRESRLGPRDNFAVPEIKLESEDSDSDVQVVSDDECQVVEEKIKPRKKRKPSSGFKDFQYEVPGRQNKKRKEDSEIIDLASSDDEKEPTPAPSSPHRVHQLPPPLGNMELLTNLLKTMSHINSEFFQLFVEPDDKHCYVPTAYHKDWPRILTWSQMMTAYERSYNMAQQNYLSEVTNNEGYSKDCGFPHPSVFTSTKTSTASSSIGSTVLL